MLQRRQCLTVRVQLENSWRGYGSESDSRQGYALDGLLPRNLCPLETGGSGVRRGNDMPQSGKVILKVTIIIIMMHAATRSWIVLAGVINLAWDLAARDPLDGEAMVFLPAAENPADAALGPLGKRSCRFPGDAECAAPSACGGGLGSGN